MSRVPNRFMWGAGRGNGRRAPGQASRAAGVDGGGAGFQPTTSRGFLGRLVGRADRSTTEYVVYEGTRTDLASGRGPRVRVGLLTDGSYGIERWTSAGVPQVPTWS